MKGRLLMLAAFYAFVISSAKSEIASENVTVGGHFLGVGNSIWQADYDTIYNDRRQFDYALNLDLEIRFNSQINGFVQFQTSPGRGSFGFPGPSPDVTDLYLQFELTELKSILTAGSFDTPFGINTNNLTNNADATKNAFFLNSLMYGVLGGQAGTLNAVGTMVEFDFRRIKFSSSVFNNLSETSENADPNFGFTFLGSLNFLNKCALSGSFLKSNEQRDKDLSAWLAELIYDDSSAWFIKLYFGKLEYQDSYDFTEDNVLVWMGELGVHMSQWRVAFRTSGWQPEDRNGNSSGMSFSLPLPGLIKTGVGLPFPPRDQKVVRYQAAVTKHVNEQLSIKAELFRDDYNKLANGKSTDVDGLAFLLQGSF